MRQLRITRCVRALAAGLVLASPALALAEEAGKGTEFSFGDLGQLLASVLVFFGLLAVLGKWAWKPIVTQLQKREDDITRKIETAQLREKEAQDLLAQYKAQLEKAQGEVQELLAQGRKDAAQARTQILATAQEEARRSMDRAVEDIGHAKDSALRELYDTTAILAVDVAGKILRQKLQPQDQRNLVDEALGEIRQRSKVRQ